MAQTDNKFTAFWMDTSTAPWTPLTWLSATILIKLAESPYTVVVNNESMTDIWNGDYIYEYTGYDSNKNYIYHCNPGATAYIESGVTDKRLDHIDRNLSDIQWWGGLSVNLSGVTGSITKLDKSIKKLIEEEHNKTRTLIETKDNDTKSHIDIVKTDIIDTINDIEIPDESDLSDVIGWIGVLKARFTKLSEWLKVEQKKELENKDSENDKKLSELQGKIDDMEEVFKDMEEIKGSEITEKQKLIEDMEQTAQEIIDDLEKEKVKIKEETERQTKDKLISSLSE